MIPKQPKKPAIVQKLLGGVLIFEALAFGGSFLIWRKLNDNREFREQAKAKAPWVLELYYKMGEMMSDNNKIIRESDEKTWAYNAEKMKKNTQSEN